MSKTLIGSGYAGQNFFDSSSLTIRYVGLAGARSGTPITAEASTQAKIYQAGTLSRMSFYVSVNTQDASSNWRLRVNSASVNQVVSVAANTTGAFQDTTNSDAISAGDRVNYAHDPLESLDSFTVTSSILEFEGTSETATVWASCEVASGTTFNNGTASVTRYAPLTGIGNSGGWFNSTEANSAVPIRSDGTFDRLGVYVASNTSTNDMTVNWRTSGAGGSQTLTIGAATTGHVEDATNSDVVASGDTVDLETISGAGTVNANVRLFYATFVSDGTNWDMRARTTQTATQTFSTGATSFLPLMQSDMFKDLTEATVQAKCPMDTYADHLILVIPTNSSNSVSPVSRINGGNGNLTVTVGNTATGTFEDTTHVDTLAADDLYCLSYGTPTSTTVCVQCAGVRMDTVDPVAGSGGRARRIATFL